MELEPLSGRRGNWVSAQTRRLVTRISAAQKNNLPVLKVKATTKEMLIDSRRKRPTHAPTTINGAQTLRWKSSWLMTSPGPYTLPLLRHQILLHVWKHWPWPLFRTVVETRATVHSKVLQPSVFTVITVEFQISIGFTFWFWPFLCLQGRYPLPSYTHAKIDSADAPTSPLRLSKLCAFSWTTSWTSSMRDCAPPETRCGLGGVSAWSPFTHWKTDWSNVSSGDTTCLI